MLDFSHVGYVLGTYYEDATGQRGVNDAIHNFLR